MSKEPKRNHNSNHTKNASVLQLVKSGQVFASTTPSSQVLVLRSSALLALTRGRFVALVQVVMPQATTGLSYPGTQSYEGKYHGTGFYPNETLRYFEFFFKGKQAEHTGFMPNELLFETLTTNSPAIKVLDCERRNLDSETMGAIMNCLLTNTQVHTLKIARNVSFWSEQPDDFGSALAAVLKNNKTITKVDIKNNDIHETAMVELMEALKTNTTVTWLDMSDNFCRGKGGAIAEMIAVRAPKRAAPSHVA